MSDKRVIPPALLRILKADIALTGIFCHAVEKVLPPSKSEKYLKYLEISCHGLPWLCVSIALFWILWNPELFEMQVNFIIGIVLDMFFVTLLKAAVRRRRPKGNKGDMFMVYGTDVYSFPSGHTSRAVYIACFFSQLYPVNTLVKLILFAWAISIGVSRVLLKRHFLLDVAGGTLLGFLEAGFSSVFWIGRATSIWLVSSISEEGVNLEGLQDATVESGD